MPNDLSSGLAAICILNAYRLHHEFDSRKAAHVPSHVNSLKPRQLAYLNLIAINLASVTYGKERQHGWTFQHRGCATGIYLR